MVEPILLVLHQAATPSSLGKQSKRQQYTHKHLHQHTYLQLNIVTSTEEILVLIYVKQILDDVINLNKTVSKFSMGISAKPALSKCGGNVNCLVS